MDIKKKPNITTQILQLISEYETLPYDINNGMCEEFAMTIIKRMGGYSNYLTEYATSEKYWDRGYPGHIWVHYNGVHYDAECPCGVTQWQYLPIFVKHRRRWNNDGNSNAPVG